MQHVGAATRVRPWGRQAWPPWSAQRGITGLREASHAAGVAERGSAFSGLSGTRPATVAHLPMLQPPTTNHQALTARPSRSPSSPTAWCSWGRSTTWTSRCVRSHSDSLADCHASGRAARSRPARRSRCRLCTRAAPALHPPLCPRCALAAHVPHAPFLHARCMHRCYPRDAGGGVDGDSIYLFIL